MAVLGAAAMGEGRPYRPASAAASHAHRYTAVRVHAHHRPFPLPSRVAVLQQHLLVLAAAAAASVGGGWALAQGQGWLAGSGLVKGLWVWHALKQGRKPSKPSAPAPGETGDAPAPVYVGPGWLLLQGALASAIAVGVQEHLLRQLQQHQQPQQSRRPPLLCFLRGRHRARERGEGYRYEAVPGQGKEGEEEDDDEWAWGEDEAKAMDAEEGVEMVGRGGGGLVV